VDRELRQTRIGNLGFSGSKKVLQGEYKTHWHEFYEIEYILKGEGNYVIDGVVYPIRPGMLFFMTPRNFHSVSAQNCQAYNLMFSERLCDLGMLSRLIDGKTAFDTEEDLPFFDAVLGELVKSLSDEALVGFLLNSVLGKIRPEPRGMTSDSVAKGFLYLLNHFREKPSLCEIADYAGYTPTYFSAVYRKEMGETFQQTLDRLRFDYAKKLVLHSDLTVARICKESGFDDYPNFIRRFKKYFGVSPGKMKMGISP